MNSWLVSRPGSRAGTTITESVFTSYPSGSALSRIGRLRPGGLACRPDAWLKLKWFEPNY